MQKIETGIYKLKMPPFGPPAWEVSNVYFVGDGAAFIIDAGYPTPESKKSIIDAWRELGRPKIEAILITHAHPDHAGALIDVARETNSPVWLHKLEADFLGRYFPTESIGRLIGDGEIIEAGATRLKVFHVPGHTPGHLCFLDESRSFLFTGDHIVGTGYAVIMPPQGDMMEYMAGLRRMAKFELKKILPGHGPLVDDPASKIREYIEHRILREIQILKHIDAGAASIAAMADEIYSDLHPVLRHAGRYQILAHLIKMEADGLVYLESGSGTDAVYFSKVGKLPF